MNRKLFVWNANDFCKRFKEKMALEFVNEWEAWTSETVDIPESGMPPAKKVCRHEDEEFDEKWMNDRS